MEKTEKLRERNSLHVKVVLAIIVLAGTIGVVMVTIGCFVYKNAMDEHYIAMATNVNETLISVMDDESIERFEDVMMEYIDANGRVSGGKDLSDEYKNRVLEDPDYMSAIDLIRELKSKNDAEYVYLVYPIDDGQYFVMDSDEDSDGSFGDYMDFVDGLDANTKEFIAGEEVPAFISHSEYGWLVTVLTRYVHDGRFLGYMCVDISMNDVVNDRYGFLFTSIIFILVAMLLAGIFNYMWFNHILVKPIQTITKAAREYIRSKDGKASNEEESSISRLNIKTNDEIENLADAMKSMEQDINDYIDNLAAVTKEKERIGAELNVATQIQKEMLPSIFPAYPNRAEFDLFASMRPAKEVGGDFYDFFMVDDDHLVLVMADVSGKGVPAALFMVISKTLIKSCATNSLNPMEILTVANNQLCEGKESALFVTVWLSVITISTGEMLVSNAGHEYPAIYRASEGKYELVKGKHSMPVAVMEDAPFKCESYVLEPGDCLYIYTDGVPEAADINDKFFGTERMMNTLNKKKYENQKELLDEMIKDVDEFVGDASQFDDITMLGFEYFGSKAQ